jgi:hypothetical protein
VLRRQWAASLATWLGLFDIVNALRALLSTPNPHSGKGIEMNEDTIAQLEGLSMHPQTIAIAEVLKQVMIEVDSLNPESTEEHVAVVLIAIQRLNLTVKP